MSFYTSLTGLNSATAQLAVTANNIANADTPNYKAQDVDFKAMLKEVKTEYLTATNEKHYAGIQDAPDNGMRFRTPFNSSFDGNTVEMNVEQAQYGKAASEYQATLQFLQNRIGGLRKAMRGE